MSHSTMFTCETIIWYSSAVINVSVISEKLITLWLWSKNGPVNVSWYNTTSLEFVFFCFCLTVLAKSLCIRAVHLPRSFVRLYRSYYHNIS